MSSTDQAFIILLYLFLLKNLLYLHTMMFSLIASILDFLSKDEQ